LKPSDEIGQVTCTGRHASKKRAVLVEPNVVCLSACTFLLVEFPVRLDLSLPRHPQRSDVICTPASARCNPLEEDPPQFGRAAPRATGAH